MKIKHQLSVATLVMAGVFATGCSQQSVMGEGASQVAGGQQVAGGAQVAGGQQVSGGEQVAGGQQVAGGEQVAGGQQVSGGEQVAGGQQVAGDTQVAGGQQMAGDQQTMDSQIPEKMVPKTPVAPAKPMTPAKPMVKPKQVMKPKPMAPRPGANTGNCHGHAANSMTKTVRHCHKNPRGQHNYKAKQAARPAAPRPAAPRPAAPRVVTKTVYKPVPKVVYKDRVVYKPVYKTVYKPAPAKKAPARKPVNRWCHSHPANSLTKSVSHCHKYNQRNHSHMYGGKKPAAKRYVAPKPAYVAPAAPKAVTPPPVDVFALQQKLKAKGYYKGPIDGVVGSGTRAALQQFMQNR